MNATSLSALPFVVATPALPPIDEGRSVSQARQAIRKQEHQLRVWDRALRLFEPLVDDPGLSTTGYVMKLLACDGHLTGYAKVGKPASKDNDYTTPDGGPYIIALETGACSCPFYQEQGFCKHGLGACLWLHTFSFGVSEKGYVLWQQKEPDVAEETPLTITEPAVETVQDSPEPAKKSRTRKKVA